MNTKELNDHVLRDLYTWVDNIPLSRPKKNIARDFSDGVLMAEVIRHFFPKYIEVHNYPTCNKVDAKRNNWMLLNWKVFQKLNFKLSDDVIESLINSRPGTIEKLLLLLRSKLSKFLEDYESKSQEELSFSPQKVAKYPPVTVSSKVCPQQSEELDRIYSHDQHYNSKNTANIQNHQSYSRRPQDYLKLDPKSAIPTKDSGKMAYSRELAYEEKIQECLALEETIEILNAKVRRMAHLLELKDIRINELQAKLNSAFSS